MSACLVCGCERSAPLFTAPDRLYRTTAKEFAVVRCEECGLARLDPQPAAEELRRYYPENYWFAPDESAASRMAEAYRRLVLRDHVRFVTRALGGGRDQILAHLVERRDRSQRRLKRVEPGRDRRFPNIVMML